MNITSARTRLGAIAVATAALVGLVGCSATSGTTDSSTDSAALETLKVGALATPAGDILAFVQDNLAAGRGALPDAAFWRRHGDLPGL